MGSYDTYAASAERKKDPGEGDETFIKEIDSWQEMPAHNPAPCNANLTQRELNMLSVFVRKGATGT